MVDTMKTHSPDGPRPLDRRFRASIAIAAVAGLAIGALTTYVLTRVNSEEARIQGAALLTESVVVLEIATCDADEIQVEMVERPTAVEVTVIARGDFLHEDSCQDVAVMLLNEPLGERTLIDGSVGSEVNVRRSLPG